MITQYISHIYYQINIQTVFRGHHENKATWPSILNGKLAADYYNRTKAQKQDKYKIAIQTLK